MDGGGGARWWWWYCHMNDTDTASNGVSVGLLRVLQVGGIQRGRCRQSLSTSLRRHLRVNTRNSVGRIEKGSERSV